MSIKRYGFRYIGGNDSIWDGEQSNGEYCEYSDYEDLQSRVKRLEAALRHCIIQMEWVIAEEWVSTDSRFAAIKNEGSAALTNDAGEGA